MPSFPPPHVHEGVRPGAPVVFEGHWHLEPELLAGLLLIALLYGLAIGPWRGRLAPGRKFPRRKAIYFYSALTVFYLAVASPLDELAEKFLFTAHMIQHNLLIYAVALLLPMGTPEWALRTFVDNRVVRPVVRFFTYPIVALILYNVVYAVWHIPGFYEWALRDRQVHNLEHISFVLTAIATWWPLVNPMPRVVPGMRTYGGKMMYVFALALSGMPIFAYLSFGSEVHYPTYEFAPRIVDLSPLGDQVLGGIVMKVNAMGMYLAVWGVLFYRWYKESERSATAPAAAQSA